MKHIFVFNPAAGQGTALSQLKEQLQSREDCELYITKRPEDATVFVRQRIKEMPQEQLCFIACGGDGTIREVAAGVLGQENACFSVYPCGSGNDFVKVFGGSNRFLNPDALLAAKPMALDILKVDDRYSMNVCSFGFDTAVLKTMSAVKRKPIIGGKNAYYTGIVKALCSSMKTGCTITADGESFFSGDLLLCTFANGQYVGGSFRCAPRAELSDGLIEVCLCKPISRLSFVNLIGSYTKGEHLDDPRMKDIIVYRRAKTVTIESQRGLLPLSLDGEVVEKKRYTIEVIPGGVNFALPDA